jgi:hypothetical protein
MTIHYVVSTKGGSGKTLVATLLGHILPDPCVIEHASADDAAPAFPADARRTITFTGEATQDLLNLESAIGELADHQNIVINTPPSRGMAAIAEHTRMLAPMGEQFGHESRVYLVVNDSTRWGAEDAAEILAGMGSKVHVVLNDCTGDRTIAEDLAEVIAESGAQIHNIPRMPHRALEDFLRERKPERPSLVTRVIGKRYLDACRESLAS